MEKWIGNECAAEDAENEAGLPEIAPTSSATSRPASKWKPIPLSVLFGGEVKCSERRQEVDEEMVLMEVLADQEEDERLDDGAIDMSGTSTMTMMYRL